MLKKNGLCQLKIGEISLVISKAENTNLVTLKYCEKDEDEPKEFR